MPFYTFKCPECEDVKEVLQKMNDSPPNCDNCTKMVPRHIIKMERVFANVGKPQFKGNGFYETDIVTTELLGKMRGQQLARLSVAPFQYNPTTNELRVITKLEVKIVFENIDYHNFLINKV